MICLHSCLITQQIFHLYSSPLPQPRGPRRRANLYWRGMIDGRDGGRAFGIKKKPNFREFLENNSIIFPNCFANLSMNFSESFCEKLESIFFFKKFRTIFLSAIFSRGFPSHERNETLLSTITASQEYSCEKWHPSLMMTASQVYTCAKDSLSEKLVLKYATLGSPFIRGFPSHEWYDTHPWWWLLAKCTRVQKIRFLKSQC